MGRYFNKINWKVCYMFVYIIFNYIFVLKNDLLINSNFNFEYNYLIMRSEFV